MSNEQITITKENEEELFNWALGYVRDNIERPSHKRMREGNIVGMYLPELGDITFSTRNAIGYRRDSIHTQMLTSIINYPKETICVERFCGRTFNSFITTKEAFESLSDEVKDEIQSRTFDLIFLK